MARHSINLAKKSRCMEHIIKEAIEFELHPDTVNREEGFFLSNSLKHFV
jgi:hypothetical protein